MAFFGLVQWTQAVVTQSARASEARDRLASRLLDPMDTPNQRTQAAQRRFQATGALYTECHFFAIAALKLLEYRDWVLTFGLCASVDFSEVDQFSARDIRDLRDIGEHISRILQGNGETSRPMDKGDARAPSRGPCRYRNPDRRAVGLGCIWGRGRAALTAIAGGASPILVIGHAAKHSVTRPEALHRLQSKAPPRERRGLRRCSGLSGGEGGDGLLDRVDRQRREWEPFGAFGLDLPLVELAVEPNREGVLVSAPLTTGCRTLAVQAEKSRSAVFM